MENQQKFSKNGKIYRERDFHKYDFSYLVIKIIMLDTLDLMYDFESILNNEIPCILNVFISWNIKPETLIVSYQYLWFVWVLKKSLL